MTAPKFPQLAVACPYCKSAAGELCTSHSGSRVRKNNVHQQRTAAWKAASAPAGRGPEGGDR